jgi:hypothetical protein
VSSYRRVSFVLSFACSISSRSQRVAAYQQYRPKMRVMIHQRGTLDVAP